MPALIGSGNDLLGLGDGRSEKLLGEDVLSSLSGAEHQRVVRGSRRRYGDRVDVVAGEQVVEIRNEARPDRVGAGSSPGGIVVPGRDELGVRMLLSPCRVLRCMHVPESENRYLDRI